MTDAKVQADKRMWQAGYDAHKIVTRDLIRELIEALEDFELEHSYSSKKEALVARAKVMLEND